MAVTATLCYRSPNHLRYRLNFDGVAGTGLSFTFTTTGQPANDLLTDSLQGPLKKLAKCVADGFGQFSPGPQLQANARALWLSHRLGGGALNPAIAGNPLITTAIAKLTDLPDGLMAWGVDADVDGAGNPTLIVSSAIESITPDGCFLDVVVPLAIGI